MDRRGMTGLVDAMAFLLIAILICASLSIASPRSTDPVPEGTGEVHRTLLQSSMPNPCGPGNVSIMGRVAMEVASDGISDLTRDTVNETLQWLLGPSVCFCWTVIGEHSGMSLGGTPPDDGGLSTDRVVTNDVRGKDVTIGLTCWWS